MNRFKVICTGRNHPDWAQEALDSLAAQTDERFDVCVVDDASDQDLFNVLGSYGWLWFCREERAYALANQILAWTALEPSEDDVIVWLDLDDRLPHAGVLERLRAIYDESDALLTYGSYRPFPQDHPNAANCRPAKPYDETVRRLRTYRGTVQWFNHLRSMKWRVLREITDQDLRRSDGNYFQANTDRAVMFPALELAGNRAVFVEDVLYEYRCNSEDAVWKTMNPLLVAEDQELRARPRKAALDG